MKKVLASTEYLSLEFDSGYISPSSSSSTPFSVSTPASGSEYDMPCDRSLHLTPRSLYMEGKQHKDINVIEPNVSIGSVLDANETYQIAPSTCSSDKLTVKKEVEIDNYEGFLSTKDDQSISFIVNPKRPDVNKTNRILDGGKLNKSGNYKQLLGSFRDGNHSIEGYSIFLEESEKRGGSRIYVGRFPQAFHESDVVRLDISRPNLSVYSVTLFNDGDKTIIKHEKSLDGRVINMTEKSPFDDPGVWDINNQKIDPMEFRSDNNRMLKGESCVEFYLECTVFYECFTESEGKYGVYVDPKKEVVVGSWRLNRHQVSRSHGLYTAYIDLSKHENYGELDMMFGQTVNGYFHGAVKQMSPGKINNIGFTFFKGTYKQGKRSGVGEEVSDTFTISGRWKEGKIERFKYEDTITGYVVFGSVVNNKLSKRIFGSNTNNNLKSPLTLVSGNYYMKNRFGTTYIISQSKLIEDLQLHVPQQTGLAMDYEKVGF